VLVLLVVLIVVPIIELAVMVQVAGIIGVLPTVGLVVAMCVAGAWLMKVEGVGVVRRMQAQVGAGELPAAEVVNGVLILLGGLLMLVPGFVTGVIGLLLLLPPVRALLRPLVLARVQRRLDRGRARFAVFSTDGRVGRVYDAEAHLAAEGEADSPAPRRPELGA
jgi:UPF0716 protein FxsA